MLRFNVILRVFVNILDNMERPNQRNKDFRYLAFGISLLGMIIITAIMAISCNAQTQFSRGIIIGNTENAALIDSITIKDGRPTIWFNQTTPTVKNLDLGIIQEPEEEPALTQYPPWVYPILLTIVIIIIFWIVNYIKDNSKWKQKSKKLPMT